MESHNSRYVITFNGEIYNHLELRQELDDDVAWLGHSDTETLLECINRWGIEVALKRSVGMFAFALWDKAQRRLLLARDRFGEKPLYYGYRGRAFVFGSELKALASLAGPPLEVDRGSVALLLRHSQIPTPYSIFSGISKLAPGSWIELDAHHLEKRSTPAPSRYWSPTNAAFDGVANPLNFGSDDEAVSALEAQLATAVKGQMMSDVPLGAFLSGGIDSSVVVATMQKFSRTPIKTFTIGFREDEFDEARFAAPVARHLGTEHVELYVSHSDARDVIPSLPLMYDEPFADCSQIPTYLVAKLARQRVTVALSGDGGDELFGGYTRYVLAARIWSQLNRIPEMIRRRMSSVILGVSPGCWDVLYRLLTPFIASTRRLRSAGEKLHKGAPLLTARDGLSLYRALLTHWDGERVVPGAPHRDTALSSEPEQLVALRSKMMLLDAMFYLPDDILVKVDRAAMMCSLETRVPFLDHRLFEFAWRVPDSYKFRGRGGKWLLRQLLYRYVPPNLVDRPKMGFGVPLGSWLRGPLREWAEELLSVQRLSDGGYFDVQPIRQKWSQHLTGEFNWQFYLWDVLMFQAWRARWAK
jgi:asparagine synthase (glutamine-hydrolysing)